MLENRDRFLLLAALCAVGHGCFLKIPGRRTNNLKIQTDKQQTPYENWMRDLPPWLQKIPLNRLVIPGAHNAFANEFSNNFANDFFHKARDAAAQTRRIDFWDWVNDFKRNNVPGNKKWDSLGLFLAGLMRPWAVTQNIGIRKQLESGVRYLDMRICDSQGETYFCHSLLGSKTVFETFVEEILPFLDSHPKEIVIAHFQWIYVDYFQNWVELQYRLNATLGHYIVEEANPSELNLETIWKTGRRLIIIYKHSSYLSGLTWWKDRKTMTMSEVKHPKQHLFLFLSRETAFWMQVGKRNETFFVLSGAASFGSGLDIVTSITEYDSLEKNNDQVLPGLVRWVKVARADYLNIVSADFVEKYHFISTVIQKNYNITHKTSD